MRATTSTDAFRSPRAVVCLRALAGVAFALLAALPAVQADEQAPSRDLLVSTHVRLEFPQAVQRAAVGDESIITFEILSERELLILGRSLGRTSVMVWFADGTTQTYLFHVRRDLSLLEEALKEIHPSISVRSAPDRDAVVLRGTVPDVAYANAAEEMAQRYLDARRGGRGSNGSPAVRAPGATPPEGEAPPAGPAVEPLAEVRSAAAVINLIRVESLPGRLEDRMEGALQRIGGAQVNVTRLVRGRLPDDEHDVFVLRGKADTQTQLIRILSVAQSMLGVTGNTTIRVRADESGALSAEAGRSGGGASMATSGGSLSQLFGGSGGGNLQNLIDANIGRAKVIEAAGGRILSFIDVSDLPQVRVDIRLYEVNSTKLRQFNSQLGVIGSNFNNRNGLSPSPTAVQLQGLGNAQRVGMQGNDPDVQNVLGFLAGTLTNQFQLSTDNFAIDSLLSLLESRGFARSLSRPSLTVLSGEQAFFQVGGEIPVPQSFASAANVATGGVFNSVIFRPFGVQLSVRPLVGEEGTVTLDVAPQISLPDAQLTAGIRQATGTAQSTTSFRTRSMQTTARLRDGQALLVGGLITRDMTSADSSTPGLSDLPLVGGLFSGYDRQSDEFQLVVVVHPVLVRAPSNQARLWAFPHLEELVRRDCQR